MGFDPARQKQHPLSIFKPWGFLHGTAHEVYRVPIPSLCTALNFCYKTGGAAGPRFLRYHFTHCCFGAPFCPNAKFCSVRAAGAQLAYCVADGTLDFPGTGVYAWHPQPKCGCFSELGGFEELRPMIFFHKFWMILGFPFEEPPPNVGVLYDQGAFEVIPSEMGKSWQLLRLLRVVARLNFKKKQGEFGMVHHSKLCQAAVPRACNWYSTFITVSWRIGGAFRRTAMC